MHTPCWLPTCLATINCVPLCVHAPWQVYTANNNNTHNQKLINRQTNKHPQSPPTFVVVLGAIRTHFNNIRLRAADQQLPTTVVIHHTAVGVTTNPWILPTTTTRHLMWLRVPAIPYRHTARWRFPRMPRQLLRGTGAAETRLNVATMLLLLLLWIGHHRCCLVTQHGMIVVDRRRPLIVVPLVPWRNKWRPNCPTQPVQPINRTHFRLRIRGWTKINERAQKTE